MGGFIAVLDKFATYRDSARPSINRATVAVTERYARKKLGIKKDEPLIYRGLTLQCVGSKRWRERRFDASAANPGSKP
jgi:hypothetical protein